jgi:periplasmic protein CpxP/Spy
MMKTKPLLVTLTALFIFTGSAAADTASLESVVDIIGKQHNMRSKPLQAFSQLALTVEQQAAMQQVIQNHRKNWQADATGNTNRKHGHDRQAWQAIMDAPQFDATSARELLEKNQTKRLERQLRYLQLRHELRQLLTEEQRQQLDEQRRQPRLERPGEQRRAKLRVNT